MFWYAYPQPPAGYGQHLTLPVVAVYFVGLMTTFWCLFAAVVNFKTRNDPGGKITMEVTRKGETKIVEVEKPSGLGGIGVFGDAPAGAEAVTNPVSDGGASSEDISSPMGTGRERTTSPRTNPTDVYCGNCIHFDYVRTDSGMTPYCGLHERQMADMDACERWQSSTANVPTASFRPTPSGSLSRTVFRSPDSATPVFCPGRVLASPLAPEPAVRCSPNNGRGRRARGRTRDF